MARATFVNLVAILCVIVCTFTYIGVAQARLSMCDTCAHGKCGPKLNSANCSTNSSDCFKVFRDGQYERGCGHSCTSTGRSLLNTLHFESGTVTPEVDEVAIVGKPGIVISCCQMNNCNSAPVSSLADYGFVELVVFVLMISEVMELRFRSQVCG